LQGALRIAEELDAAHPDRPTLIGNIASIKEGLRANQEEIEMLYQRAAELDPTYLFAQAGLARIAARKGDVARAKELLRLLQGREEYHVSEWRALLAIERQIALAEHDMAAVFRVDDALDDLNKQFG
jgi:Tfp pilus assembly protein PilF